MGVVARRGVAYARAGGGSAGARLVARGCGMPPCGARLGVAAPTHVPCVHSRDDQRRHARHTSFPDCGRRRLHHALKQGSQWRKPPPSPPRPPSSIGLDLGATLGELLSGAARRISAREGGGRVVGPARLPPPGDGAASPTEGEGARAAEPEAAADPGGSWWSWGARHADEGDDDEQPERDELRRRIRMK